MTTVGRLSSSWERADSGRPRACRDLCAAAASSMWPNQVKHLCKSGPALRPSSAWAPSGVAEASKWNPHGGTHAQCYGLSIPSGEGQVVGKGRIRWWRYSPSPAPLPLCALLSPNPLSQKKDSFMSKGKGGGQTPSFLSQRLTGEECDVQATLHGGPLGPHTGGWSWVEVIH